jgi:hypothetical protein
LARAQDDAAHYVKTSPLLINTVMMLEISCCKVHGQTIFDIFVHVEARTLSLILLTFATPRAKQKTTSGPFG